MTSPVPAGRIQDVLPPAGRRSAAAISAHLRSPLYGQGYALALNSGLTSLLGVVYWLVAVRYYTPHTLGLNSAAISAMMFLAGVSQLNLMSALMRFIPVSGLMSTRLVRSSYLVAVTLAAVVSVGFLIGLDMWAPALGFLTSSPGFALWFVAATMAWCVFNLQDSVLIGLRAAIFVPIENLVFSLVKIALLVAFVGVSPHYGIFASWTAALAASLVPVNLIIFRRLLPRHVGGRDDRLRPPTRGQITRFVSADYLGSLFWLAATALMPVLVVALEGGTANAYFALAWMIALPLYGVTTNTGASLVVTASRDEPGLPTYARRVLIQTAALVVPLALGLALAAPEVLRLFGAQYAEHSHVTLSLLALSAIPNTVTALYVSVYRVQRRMSLVVMLLGALCGLVLGLGVTFLQLFGIAGVGLAWLIAESLVAAVLLLVEPGALWPSARGRSPAGARPARLAEMLRNLAADLRVLGLLVPLRGGRGSRRRAREAKRMTPEILSRVPPIRDEEPPTSWSRHRVLTSVSDMSVMTVGSSGQAPRAVVKLPATELAVRSLRREREVLAALRGDARLREWCGVLPTMLAEGELAGRPYVVQRMLPGVPASRMVASDQGAWRVLTAAASTIRELHRRTAAPAVIDEAVLQHWVDCPARIVRDGDAQAGRGAADVAMDRLVDELHGALAGRTLQLGWVHGDFVPSNILVRADGQAVSGIVDWELAACGGLPSIDVVALLLATRAQRQRRELGRVVRELMSGAPWTAYEWALLDSGCADLPGGRLESRTLVLLWWLQHVAANMTKSTRYDRSGLWARWNIRGVLDALEEGR
jgi:aminoglycoside phosphotransferase (APT) family kinase protein/O-antigen/teichoic acid export membrane protein